MKLIITWILIGSVIAGETALLWLFPNQGIPDWIQTLGGVASVIVVIATPVWLSGSAWFVKRAIDGAKREDWVSVRFFLISRGWFIYPSPRYMEIVRLVRQLSADYEKEPRIRSKELKQYIVYNGSRYSITPDGWEKMIDKINSGWINGRFFENPNYLQLLLRAVAIIAVIRGIVLILNIIFNHR
jgi:hypothetical protein